MRKLLCAVMLISVLFAACACANTAEPVIPEITDEDLYAVKMEEEQWPVIDGAPMFLRFYTAAAARMLETSEEEASRYVLSSSTDFAYRDLIYGRADIIFSFLPDQEYAELAGREGVTLACYPVLNEAFVFFTSPDNPVDGLTIDQLRGIYTGQITNWSEVGGKNEPITAFRRSEGSSDHAGLVQFVAKEEELAPGPTEERPGTMGETADVPKDYDGSSGALGCGYLYNVSWQYGLSDLKLLAIDGIEPSASNIQNRIYPMISQVCAVIRGGEEETQAGQLAQWCAWPLGQKLAKEMGYEPNMPVDETTLSPAESAPGTEDGTDWAEGNAVPRGSGKTLHRNALEWSSELLYNDESRYVSVPVISGLKDKAVEEAINGRIRSVIDAFCDPDHLPDVQGIETYKAEGLKPSDSHYLLAGGSVEGNSDNILSVVLSCTATYDIPARGKSGPQSLFFAVCEPLNFDLRTGKEIPLTALVSDDMDALPYLNGLVQKYCRYNADTVYRDEDDFSTPEGIGTIGVRVTSLPGLKKDQKYYLDDSLQTIYLVLDVNTPWGVTGTDFSCIPLDLENHAAFTRFHTEESLFE